MKEKSVVRLHILAQGVTGQSSFHFAPRSDWLVTLSGLQFEFP